MQKTNNDMMHALQHTIQLRKKITHQNFSVSSTHPWDPLFWVECVSVSESDMTERLNWTELFHSVSFYFSYLLMIL